MSELSRFRMCDMHHLGRFIIESIEVIPSDSEAWEDGGQVDQLIDAIARTKREKWQELHENCYSPCSCEDGLKDEEQDDQQDDQPDTYSLQDDPKYALYYSETEL